MTNYSSVCRSCFRKSFSSGASSRHLSTASPLPECIGTGRYQEGDRVLASYKDGRYVRNKLLPPLKIDGVSSIGGNNISFHHNDIIGQPSRRLYLNAYTKNGPAGSVRITHPSFDDFVALAPRTVTPIYASYSAFMTNLLDIHVEPPSTHNDPQVLDRPTLEILEAGTGHGSLTIHLARAIAAANPVPPDLTEVTDEEGALEDAWKTWKKSRRAVLHTVEFQPPRSKDAQRMIRGFRGGLYWPHIDFHSGDAGKWISRELDRRRQSGLAGSGDGFLDIVCLDMPNVHSQIEQVCDAMKNYGQLLVYVPQITQLAVCQQIIERLRLPLKLHQVTELGEGISNGRVWDLRFLTPRAEQRSEQQRQDFIESEPVSGTVEEALSLPEIKMGQGSNPAPSEHETPSATASESIFPTMVCRPMVGRLIMGGAFVGLWRKVDKL